MRKKLHDLVEVIVTSVEEKGNLSNTVSNSLQKNYVKLVDLSSALLKQHLCNAKDEQDRLNKCGVYRLSCPECQTGWPNR